MTAEQKPGSQSPHSYEQYAQSDASVGINKYTLGKIIGQRKRLLDVGSGTGASIQAALEGGKLAQDFKAIGLDVDREGLLATRKKFKDYNGVDLNAQIELIHGSGEQLPVTDGWADLIICLNTVHLFDNPQSFFDDAYRVLGEGDLVVNSAYERDSTYADTHSKRVVQLMFLGARKYAKEKGFVVGLPFDPARFNQDEYKKMAEDAGFKDVEVEMRTVNMSAKDLKAIFSSEEFAGGALPQVPPMVAIEGLVASVEPAMKRIGITTVDRNFMVLTARKTA